MNPIVENTITDVDVVECSICLDQIEGEKNKVVTDCNHCFHSSCLLKNVFHNGFGCPYCRTAMAEIPEEEQGNDTDDEYDEWTADVTYDNYALQGMRMLFQRAEGEEVEEYGAYEEDDLEFEDEDEEEEEDIKPSVDYIVEKLIQRGVTMRDLVSSCLVNNHEEYQSEEQLDRTDGEVFGKMRIIISNYVPASPPIAAFEEENDDEDDDAGTLLDSDLEDDIDCDSDSDSGSNSGSELDDHNDNDYCLNKIPNPDCIAKEFDKYMTSYYQDQRALRYEKILDESLVDFNSQPKTRPILSFQMKGKTSRVN